MNAPKRPTIRHVFVFLFLGTSIREAKSAPSKSPTHETPSKTSIAHRDSDWDQDNGESLHADRQGPVAPVSSVLLAQFG